MSTQHTPGPWHINAHDICAGAVAVAGVYGTTGHDAATSKANARLIASAPDLLAALKEIANGPWAIDSMREIAGHAIDKAEGR